jgi:hypothetical protein
MAKRLIVKATIRVIRVSRNPKIKRVVRRATHGTAASLATCLTNQALFHKAEVTTGLVTDFVSSQVISIAFEVARLLI